MILFLTWINYYIFVTIHELILINLCQMQITLILYCCLQNLVKHSKLTQYTILLYTYACTYGIFIMCIYTKTLILCVINKYSVAIYKNYCDYYG